MKSTKVQTLGALYVRRIITYCIYILPARKIIGMRAHKYTHAYNCTLVDKNGKQKTLYLCNKAVLGKTLQCPHSAEAVSIAL